MIINDIMREGNDVNSICVAGTQVLATSSRLGDFDSSHVIDEEYAFLVVDRALEVSCGRPV
jgi:hypothetical protein